MKILTGRTGEPHVTATQFRQLLGAVITDKTAILPVDNKLEARIVNNNTIRISDGAIIHHGCVSVVEHGTYDEVTIENGEQDKIRIDLIVLRYERTAEGFESTKWVVKKGTAVYRQGGSPRPPKIESGNLQNGDLVDEVACYTITINGINITSLSPVQDVIDKIEHLQQTAKEFSNLKNKLPVCLKTESKMFDLKDQDNFLLYTRNQIQLLLQEAGITDDNIYNIQILLTNGQGEAGYVHVMSVEYFGTPWNGWYAYMAKKYTAKVRYNISILYCPS